jgi:putative membrane protein
MARLLLLTAGCALVAAAVCPPAEGLAEGSLPWHMGQHLVLGTLAPALLVLGDPVGLLLSFAGRPRRLAAATVPRLRCVLHHPLAAGLLFGMLTVAVHLPAGEAAAERHAPLHALVHGALLACGTLLWASTLSVGPWVGCSAPARFAGLLLAMPAGDALGAWLMSAPSPLYGAGVSASGQRLAGVVMLAGSLPLAAGTAAIGWQALRQEERRARRREAIDALG